MEIYEYYTDDGQLKFGFKIWTTDDKTELSYEASGFDSRSEAETRMNEVLTDFKEDSQLGGNLRSNQHYTHAIHKGE